MRAGQIIRRTDLTINQERLAGGIFVGRLTVGGDCGQAGAVAISSLSPGTTVPADLFDEENILLVPAGTVIDPTLINQLQRRGVEVLYREDQLKQLRTCDQRVEPNQTATRPSPSLPETKATRTLDQTIEGEPTAAFALPAAGSSRRSGKRLSLADLRGEQARCEQQYERSVTKLSEVSEQILRGRSINVGMGTDLLGQFAKAIRLDPSLGLLATKIQQDDEYLFHHDLNVALISMTVASHMGYRDHEVLETGIGALFQDIGMLNVSKEIRFAQRGLTHEEWEQIEQHPIRTANILQRSGSLSNMSLMIGYQSHERCDRSGYPRRRPGPFIHPMARIVGAADTYAAVVSSRPHRAARAPYEGMTALLREAAEGRLDKTVVRAFVETMCVFPIGSYVRLSDRSVAKVLRANSFFPKAPVVVPVGADGIEADVELDLSTQADLYVEALLTPEDVDALSGVGVGSLELAVSSSQ